jgi:protein kinase-like protein
MSMESPLGGEVLEIWESSTGTGTGTAGTMGGDGDAAADVPITPRRPSLGRAPHIFDGASAAGEALHGDDYFKAARASLKPGPAPRRAATPGDSEGTAAIKMARSGLKRFPGRTGPTTKVGKGANGTVYAGNSSDDAGVPGPELAVKRGNAKAIYKEGEVLEHIGPHKNLVAGKLTDYHDKNGFAAPEISMESMKGGTLTDMHAKLAAKFPNPAALERGSAEHQQYWAMQQYITRGMLEGAAHMNTKGMMHGDIKPDNVMFDAAMTPKLIDVGGAAPLGGNPMNTQDYASMNLLQAQPAMEGDDTFTIARMLQESVENRKGKPGWDNMRMRDSPAFLANNRGIGPEGPRGKDLYRNFLKKARKGDFNPADALEHGFMSQDLGVPEEKIRDLLKNLGR